MVLINIGYPAYLYGRSTEHTHTHTHREKRTFLDGGYFLPSFAFQLIVKCIKLLTIINIQLPIENVSSNLHGWMNHGRVLLYTWFYESNTVTHAIPKAHQMSNKD